MRFHDYAPPPVLVTPDNADGVIRHCLQPDQFLGVDTETIGLLKDPDGAEFQDSKGKTHRMKYTNMTDEIVVMGLSPDEDSRYLVMRKDLHRFKGVLEAETPKALTYVKFDVHRFANAGIGLGGAWADTVHLDFLVDEDTRENRHGLKPCMKDYFGIPMRDYKELFGTEDPRTFVAGHEKWDTYLDYSTLDPWGSRKLAILLLERLKKIRIWPDQDKTLFDMYWETEELQIKTLYRMERRGFLIDKPRLEEIEASVSQEMEDIARELNRKIGRPINPNSTQQVGKWLFEEKGFTPLGYTKTGRPVCDEKTLNHFALGKDQVEECQLVVKYKKASKLRGQYARGMLKWIFARDGRIHCSFSTTKTTGRLGCSDPNLQNIPTRDPHGIRAAFIAPPGCKLVVIDHSQLEMRVLAAASGDETLINAILEGMDLHSFTACRMAGVTYEEFILAKEAEEQWALDLRTAAKSVGFGIVYGITKYKLSSDLSEKLGRYVSESEAQGYIDMYLETFPGVKRYMIRYKSMARRQGYVQTICGRFRRLSKIRSRNRGERGHAERQAINTPVQGSAADIVKINMIAIEGDDYLSEDLGFELIHQVHDELIGTVPEEHAEEAAAIVRGYMENPFIKPLQVPLIAKPKIVDNWKEGK